MNTRRKLLVVDDDDGIRELLNEQLESLGVDLVIASGYEDAMAKFKNESFHAILSDIMMPKKSGLQLLEEVRKNSSEIPVVFLTGYANEHNLGQAIRLGAVDLITKPVRQAVLIDVISRAIEIGEKQLEVVEIFKNLSDGKVKDTPAAVESIEQKKRQIALLKLINNQKRSDPK